jgi:hypothetical protein
MNSQDFRNLQEAYLDVYELDEVSGGIIGGKTFPSKNVPEKSKPNNPSKIGRGIRKSIHSASFGFSQENPKDIVSRHKEYTDNELDTVSRGKDEPKPGKGRSKSAREFQLKVIEREKRRRQKANEEVDLYDIILSHLLDEGYADTQEQAEVIMVNMSEDWRESICEGYKRFPYKKVEDKIQKKEEDNPTGRGTPQSIQMSKVVRHFKGGKEIPPVEKREHSPQISKAREAENRARGTQEG